MKRGLPLHVWVELARAVFLGFVALLWRFIFRWPGRLRRLAKDMTLAEGFCDLILGLRYVSPLGLGNWRAAFWW